MKDSKLSPKLAATKLSSIWQKPLLQQNLMRPMAPTWGFSGTLIWGALVVLLAIFLQLCSLLTIIVIKYGHLQQNALIEALKTESNSVTSLFWATLSNVLFGIPLLFAIVALKRGTNIKNYFGIKAIPFKKLLLWSTVAVGLTLLIDLATVVTGRPFVHPFMTEILKTPHQQWMLWLTLVLLAPLSEEFFFRGFMLTGWANSFLKPIGAILLTAALWAIIHTQYGLFEIIAIFITGILFGLARLKTGSIVTPLIMHIIMNFISTTEAILYHY